MLSDALDASSLSVNILFNTPHPSFMCCPHTCRLGYSALILVGRRCRSQTLPDGLSLLLTPLPPAAPAQESPSFLSHSHSDVILLLSAVNPNACRATGRGLQPKGVRVKEVADFKVFTKGAGSGELKVSVKGPSESDSLSLSLSLPSVMHQSVQHVSHAHFYAD